MFGKHWHYAIQVQCCELKYSWLCVFNISNKNDILTPPWIELHNKRNLRCLFDQGAISISFEQENLEKYRKLFCLYRKSSQSLTV